MRRTLGLVAVGALSAVLVAACGAKVEDPEVGMCFDNPDPTTTATAGISPIPCDKPHTCEIVGMFEAVGGPYPGLERLTQESQEACVADFEQYVGMNPLESVYDLYPLVPTKEAWENQDDTTVLCVARLPSDQPISGSIAGVSR